MMIKDTISLDVVAFHGKPVFDLILKLQNISNQLQNPVIAFGSCGVEYCEITGLRPATMEETVKEQEKLNKILILKNKREIQKKLKKEKEREKDLALMNKLIKKYGTEKK